MSPAVQTIAQELNINLPGIIDQLDQKEEFLACCQNYVDQATTIQALPFLTYLRKNGFPIVSKAICHFILKTNPSMLTRTLVA